MTINKIKVIKMPRASVMSDGSEIEMEFEGSNGEMITLVFDPAELDRFAGRTMQVVDHARNQKLAIGGHLSIQASEVVAAVADAPVGGGKVILALRGDNNVVQHFALQPSEAEKLRPQLFRAVKSATAQKKKTRH